MVGKVTMKVGEGITGWVAESRKPAVVPDVSREPHWKWVPGLDEDRFHSMASVPIESGPRLVGVLNVQSTERREFDSGDIDLDRKSTRLNSSHSQISYAVFCLKKKK